MQTNRILWASVVVGAIGAGVIIGSASPWRSTAGSPPGSVAQSGSTESQGITVRVLNSTFSESSAVVTVEVSGAPSDRRAWPLPAHTFLNANAAVSGKVSANGPINLVFPAVAAEPGEPLHLQIESIGYYDESANLRTVEGTWALELAAPSMEDVEQESNLQRRGPVSIDVNGAAVRIEAVLSERETVVKYSLPSGLTATGGLSVAADGRELAFHRSDVTLSGARLWFEPVPLSATLTVVFDGLLVLKPEPSDARLELQLGSLTDAPSDDYDGAHGYLLSWEQIGEGPEVDRVLVLEQPSGPAALIIDVDGSFSPHLGRRPVLIADGTAIDVVGMTNFNANSNRGPITRVEARVPLDAVPQSVIIHYSGAADAFADVTGVLAAP